MFTGIVEETGVVILMDRSELGARLTIGTEAIAAHSILGDSIAVNGCCLTITSIHASTLTFDLLGETLARTNLDEVEAGTVVNLERALGAGARLGGHFVQGHIDDTAEVISFDPAGADHRLEIALDPKFAHYVVSKGSICIDGISLTVAELKEKSMIVWIIPHTYAMTNLREKVAAQKVNLEFDMLAKYVERLMERRGNLEQTNKES